MIIDKIIHEAIRQATAERGGQAELAQKSGLGISHINKYVNGKVKGITLENWEKLAPHLKAYLPENYLEVKGHNSGNIQQHSGIGDQVIRDVKRGLTNKILDSEEIDAETKVKVLKIINDC